MNKHYDLIVIGSGAAGLTAAYTALGFGKRVLIAEKAKSGGECTWSGCIPSKALINIAKEIHTARKYAEVNVDSEQIMRQVRDVSEHVYIEETPEVLEKAGAVFVQGAARFISPREIQVGDQRFTARKFIIATGSSPFVPPIPGLDSVDYLTNETFFTQQQLPASMIVLGGGAIGVELSQAMNRLGVEVTLVEMAQDILAREEPEFAAEIRHKLIGEGVDIRINSKATKVVSDEHGIQLLVEKYGEQQEIRAEKILVAVGRQPNVANLGLETIGVKVERGIVVNKQLQSSVRNIYACGDVAGPYMLSHMANYQAKIAAMNAILPLRRPVDYQHVAWSTFSDPEFARAGLTEQEAREKYRHVRVFNYSFDKLDRAKTKAGDTGRIKLICDRKGNVLGAHIIGSRAGELISEVQVLKTLDIPFSKLQKVIHPYPTYADSLRQLSQQVYLDNLLQHPVVQVLQKIRSLVAPQRSQTA